MKTKANQTTILGLVTIILLTMNHARAGEIWNTVETNAGITIYERWVQVDAGLTVKERKGEMTLRGSMNSVINILCDPSKAKLYMENVSDAFLLTRISEKEWSSYTCFSLPWPLQNRDLVSSSMLKYCGPSSAIIEMTSRENDLPFKKNIKRLKNYKASWKITELGNGLVSVSFSAITYSPPEFPRFIQDPLLRKAFLRNLQKLKVIFSV